MDARIVPAALDAAWDFSDPEASEQRLRAAEELAPEGSLARAEWTTQVARSLGLQSRFAEAEQLLAGVRHAHPVARARVALERGRLANSSGDPAASLPHFADALALATEAGDDFLAVDAMHMLGIAQPDHAEKWTAKALQVVGASTDARTLRWGIALHNNLGWARFDAGDLVGALVEFRLAEDAAELYGSAQQKQWAREALEEAEAALRAAGTPDA